MKQLDSDIPQRTRTVWVAGNGEQIPVVKITDSHLANILNLIHRKADQIARVYKYFPYTEGGEEARDAFIAQIATYPVLKREAQKRGLRVTYHSSLLAPPALVRSPKWTQEWTQRDSNDAYEAAL